MSLLEDLKAAKAIIQDPANWTTGYYRTEKEGGGYCYCAMGAVYEATGFYNNPGNHEIGNKEQWQKTRWRLVDKALIRSAKEMTNNECGCAESVNDELGHEATMKLFDHAIAAAEKSEANQENV